MNESNLKRQHCSPKNCALSGNNGQMQYNFIGLSKQLLMKLLLSNFKLDDYLNLPNLRYIYGFITPRFLYCQCYHYLLQFCSRNPIRACPFLFILHSHLSPHFLPFSSHFPLCNPSRKHIRNSFNRNHRINT